LEKTHKIKHCITQLENNTMQCNTIQYQTCSLQRKQKTKTKAVTLIQKMCFSDDWGRIGKITRCLVEVVCQADQLEQCIKMSSFYEINNSTKHHCQYTIHNKQGMYVLTWPIHMRHAHTPILENDVLWPAMENLSVLANKILKVPMVCHCSDKSSSQHIMGHVMSIHACTTPHTVFPAWCTTRIRHISLFTYWYFWFFTKVWNMKLFLHYL
jgi:hypothetical protein